MSRIKTNIRIESEDGGNFGYFMEREDLYSKLSGIKDINDDMEFIEIGDKIQLNEHTLMVKNIHLEFAPVDLNTRHIEKTEDTMPSNFRIEVVLTVDNIPLEI
ncbi:hypothetical protein [uncultured Kriegella sp.]|uniref:hypothetical protein n=1 Tax=uncultured Kriegella sp. TaxID=1798910 RepID=UPI0030D8481F